MAERKSGPVKPPVIDLKARDASSSDDTPKKPGTRRAGRSAADKPAASTAAEGSAAAPADAAPPPSASDESKPDVTTPTAEPVKPEPVPEPAAKPEPKPAAKPQASEPPPSRTEAPRAAAAQPSPPMRQAKLAMPWSAISTAAIAGALLGTALTYALVTLVPLPASTPPIPDPTERLNEISGRLDTIESRVTPIEDGQLRTELGVEAANSAIETGLADIRSSLEALGQRVDAAQTAIADAPAVDLAPLTAQLESLESRVDAIAAGASSADASALAENLAGLDAGLAELGTRLDATQAQINQLGTLRGEIASLRSSLAAQTQTLAGASIGPVVKLPLLVSGLDSAFASGRPYATELAALTAILPELTVPPAVAGAAETGLVRPETVIEQFREALPAILAGRTAQSTGDLGQDALEWAKALLALRPSGEVAGNTPDAVVSRLETAVERRDFVAAASLLDQLPPAMQTAAGEVATAIRAHAAADAFIAALRAQALAPVTEANP